MKHQPEVAQSIRRISPLVIHEPHKVFCGFLVLFANVAQKTTGTARDN
ncbi:hypothetical protein ECW26_48090 [Escherichia coli W26]|nr:hypothetical protein ECW26_48090 [Escherichia coli W26]